MADGFNPDIAESLSDLSSTLFLLYTRASKLTSEYSPTVNSAECDLMILSHCVRELMNRLSDYLDFSAFTIQSKSGSEQRIRSKLQKELLDECEAETFIVPGDANVVVVPSNIAKVLGEYREILVKGIANNEIKSSLAVLGKIEDNPALITWKDIHSFFMNYVHLGIKTDLLPSSEDVSAVFGRLENHLTIRLGLFLDGKKKLLSILDVANEITDADRYSIPSDDDVKNALSLLGSPVLRRFFFQQLHNPEWLHPLRNNKVFKSSKPLRESADHYSDWPEALYLKRLVAVNPLEVAAAVVEACESDNPIIRAEAVDIAAELPDEYALDIARQVVAWTKSGYASNGYFWTNSHVNDLIRKLLASSSDDAKRVGKKLFTECYKPRIRYDGHFRDVHALIVRELYSGHLAELSDVIEAMKLSIRRGVFASFAKALLIGDSDEKLTSITVFSIEDACKSRANSIENEIVYQLVSSLQVGFAEDLVGCINWIKSKRSNPLVTRCALFAELKLLQKCEDEGVGLAEDLARGIRELVLSGLIVKPEFDPELYPIFPVARKLGVIESDEIDRCVTEGYKVKLEQCRAQSSENDETDCIRRCERWEHRALCLIGHEALGDEGQKLLEELSERYPCSAYSARHVGETKTITGPNSPIDASEMIKMGGDALIDHLEDWHPTQEDSWNLVTHEGQGRAVAQALEENPFLFVGKFEHVCNLRVTYQRSVIDGYGAAVSKDKGIPIDDALGLIENIAAKPEAESWQGEGDPFDDDQDYLAIRLAAVRLAETLIDNSHGKLSTDQTRSLLRSLLAFSDSNQPDARYESKYGGDNMDPLSLAINTIRPIALFALAKSFAIVQDDKIRIEVLPVLERHLPSVSDSFADAAAIGESIPHLLNVEPEWLNVHYEDLFGGSVANTCQQIVLTTVLMLYRPSPQVFDFLSSAMVSALRQDAESYVMGFRTLGNDALNLIGSWAYVGYASGYVHHDHPVLRVLRGTADAGHLGTILGNLCSMVRSGDGVSSSIAKRIAKLWDYHCQKLVNRCGGKSLSGIQSLTLSGLYSVDWWGPRLLEQLRVNPSCVSIFTLKDRLNELSDYDADLAAEVIFEIASNDSHPIPEWYSELGLNLLSNVKLTHDGNLSKAGKRCLDKLGNIGCVNLDEQLG